MKKSIFIFLLGLLIVSQLHAQDTILFDNLLYGGAAEFVIFKPDHNLMSPRWSGGLIKYNPVTDSVIEWYNRTNSLLISDFINDYAYSSDSTLWLASGSEGVFSFDENNYQCINYENSPLPYKSGRSIEFDTDDNLWITSDEGIYIKNHDSTWTFYPNDHEPLMGKEPNLIYKDNDGILYIATDRGVNIYDNGIWSYIDINYSNGYLGKIIQIHKSSFDTLYVVGERYCYIQKAAYHRKITPNDFEGLGNNFTGITETGDSNVVISGFTGFLKIGRWITELYTKNNTPGGDQVDFLSKVFYDKYRNQLFFNNRHKMINFENGEFTTSFCVGCNIIPEPRVWSIFFDNNNRFWLKGDNTIYLKEDNGWTSTNSGSIGDSWSLGFAQTTDGDLYYGGSSYIWRYKGSFWTKMSISIWLENDGLYDLTAGRDSCIYIATRNGLYQKKSTFAYFKHLGYSDRVNSVTCDKDGVIWFAMKSKIGKYENGIITYYSSFNSDLPVSNDYFSINADSMGKLWLETDTSVYFRENNNWELFTPNIPDRVKAVYVDDMNYTWLLTMNDLFIMNESDTMIYNYNNAPFVNTWFGDGIAASDNSFYTFNYPGITTLQHTQIVHEQEVADKTINLRRLINVYPNPSHGLITFELTGKKNTLRNVNNQIKISNLLGQKIATIPISDKQIIWDPVGLKPGIYIYKAIFDNKESTGKIIIE